MPHETASFHVLSSCRDPLAELQGVVANLFMILMPSTPARKKMRLTGISQPILPQATVWYLWREDFPGVFALELGEADLHEARIGTRPGPRGRFWVKYYPAMENDSFFDGLSLQEQAIRMSPLFDETGTPNLDSWEEIPEAAFVVGYIELEFQEDLGWVRVEGMARDVWKIRAQTPVDVPNGDKTIRLLEAGELDRNMSGWELLWAMLDSMVTTLGLFYATPPTGCFLWHRDIVGDCTEDNSCERHLVLHLPCPLPKTENASVPDDVFALLDQACEECARQGGNEDWLLVQPPSERLPWLNLLWWQTATDQDLGEAGLCCLLGQHDGNGSPNLGVSYTGRKEE